MDPKKQITSVQFLMVYEIKLLYLFKISIIKKKNKLNILSPKVINGFVKSITCSRGYVIVKAPTPKSAV
jgi:hypothetical protein